MNVTDWVVLVSVIAMDIYGFYVLRKAHIEIKGVNKIRDDFNDKLNTYDEKITILFGDIQEGKEEIYGAIDHAKGLMNPGVFVELGEAIVLKTLESLGMSNLKELGDKGRTVKNAKIGLQVVGDSVAKGAGVNQILEQFAPVGEKLQKGQDIMAQFDDNPLVQLGIAMFKGSGSGSGNVGSKPGAVVQELKK